MPPARSRLTAFAVAALSASLGLTIAGPADAWSPPAPPGIAIAGGYSNVPVTDPQVQAAAKFAVARLHRRGARLARIEDAQQQVVAGMNYRLRVTLTDGSRWKLAVFKPLRGQMVAGKAERLKPLPRRH
jgi:hypothetical protein